jgi:hypothetical protein
MMVLLWPAWLVWGLRYTTHDDLAASWVALDPQIGWFAFADFVAQLQRRVQAYLWMPIWLLGQAIAETHWGDLAFAGQTVALIALLGWFAGRVAGPRIGLLFIALLAFGFALHPYFMAPPGFHLMGHVSTMAFVLALYGLHRAAAGARAWLWLGAVGWLLAIMGPEYNPLAFGPLLLVAVLAFFPAWSDRLRVLLLLGAVSLAYLAVLALFRSFAGTTADMERLTVSLDGAWWPTFRALLGNAILPGTLALGVRVDVAAIGGMPVIPAQLHTGWLLGVLRSDAWYALALLLYWGGFTLLLGGPRLAWRMRLALIAAALAAALVPSAVLALSAAYQAVVPPGYLQGHLASAHAQAGLLGVLALLLGGWSLRVPTRALLALPLAFWCTGTLAYNLAMRDVLAANMQRWQAFALLAEHGGLSGRPVAAPDFWTVTGVSSIPEPLLPPSRQYWMDRARDVHGAELRLHGRSEVAAPLDAWAGYAVAPNGRPALWIEADGRLSLLSARPGHWIARGQGGELRLGTANWSCDDAACRAELPPGFARPASGPWLRPDDAGAGSLPLRLILPRRGAFGAW